MSDEARLAYASNITLGLELDLVSLHQTSSSVETGTIENGVRLDTVIESVILEQDKHGVYHIGS